jgi:hypothetical protein
MPTWHGFSVHGTAVVAELPGPSRFEIINGIEFTDVVGYRRGWGSTYRGKPNTFNWFHFAVPSLNLLNYSTAELGEVQVGFLTTNTARVQSVHVWDAHVQLRNFDNLNRSGDFRVTSTLGSNAFLFNPPLAMRFGPVGISIGVDFGSQTSDVLFTRAYARFVTP